MDAIYARQSVDKKDSLSIEGQIDYCKRFAGDDARIFSDSGYSGKNMNRPAFAELISAIEAGGIRKLYVYRLDRFSRSIADFSRLWELLEKHGVQFNSVTENFDTSSPMGRAMLNIILVFAQLERETTALRVKDNYIHRASLGAWPGGPAPYGFDLTKINDGGRNVSSLTPNGKADMVRGIFELYSEPDMTLRRLAGRLTELGIPGPRRPEWDNVTLSRILHSPLYVMADEDVYFYFLSRGLKIELPPEAFDGAHACNVIGRRDRSGNKYNSPAGQLLTVANHYGFIPSGLWLRVQEKLSDNRQLPRANAGKYSWLTGLMKCEGCGRAVKINRVKSDGSLRLLCSTRSNMSACPVEISVDIRELERYVEDAVDRMLRESPPAETDTAPEEDAEEMLDIEKKIARLVDALSESSETAAAYITRRIDRLHEQKEELAAKKAPRRLDAGPVDFHAAGFEEKKLIAAEFIDRILLRDDTAHIIWKI